VVRRRLARAPIGIRVDIAIRPRKVSDTHVRPLRARISSFRRTPRRRSKLFGSANLHRIPAAGFWRAWVEPVNSRRVLRSVPSPKLSWAANPEARELLFPNRFKQRISGLPRTSCWARSG
jgi:hypothetical protein